MKVVLPAYLVTPNIVDINNRKITIQGRIELMNQDGQFRSSYLSYFDTMRYDSALFLLENFGLCILTNSSFDPIKWTILFRFI